MIVDLHTHTLASDGKLTPQELIARAKDKGVDILAITDHDTISALPAAIQASQACGLELINGIEFSCTWSGCGIHIVGLNIDIDSPTLLDAIAQQHKRREDRAQEIGLRLSKKGIEGAYEGAKALTSGVIGRPHFAQYLIAQGHVNTLNTAFKEYLGAGKVGDVKQLWPDLSEVVKWIVDAGGVAVLAHPEKYKLTRSKIVMLCKAFIDSGGQAIEVISGLQTPNTTQKLISIATQLNLHASCGSDFHMPNQKWQELGSFGKLPPSCSPVWELWS